MPKPLPTVRQAAVDDQRADFKDAESERVFSQAALAVARELGREAAREYFTELIGKTKGSP